MKIKIHYLDIRHGEHQIFRIKTGVDISKPEQCECCEVIGYPLDENRLCNWCASKKHFDDLGIHTVKQMQDWWNESRGQEQ